MDTKKSKSDVFDSF